MGFILPFIEQNTAWDLIASGGLPNTTDANRDNLFGLVLPIMQCRSSGIMPGETRINIVANAGPPNIEGDHGAEYAKKLAVDDRPRKDAKLFTVFFSRMNTEGEWGDHAGTIVRCETKISLENISSLDGTSVTIMLSENEDGGRWIWYSKEGNTSTSSPFPPKTFPIASPSRHVDPCYMANGVENEETEGLGRAIEKYVAFCYPSDLDTIANGEVPTYEPLANPDTSYQPLFINEGRNRMSISIAEPTRLARPSSGHPGVVVAAFCDGAARTIKDDIDKTLFVRLCRPGSGVILNPKDLDF